MKWLCDRNFSPHQITLKIYSTYPLKNNPLLSPIIFQSGSYYCPFVIACLITGATDSGVIPRSLQYLVWSQIESCFCPLLALQPRQQRAIFSLVIISASLMMCSQLAEALVDTVYGKKSLLQYTQTLSLSRTSCSSDAGIFQLFAIIFIFWPTIVTNIGIIWLIFPYKLDLFLT